MFVTHSRWHEMEALSVDFTSKPCADKDGRRSRLATVLLKTCRSVALPLLTPHHGAWYQGQQDASRPDKDVRASPQFTVPVLPWNIQLPSADEATAGRAGEGRSWSLLCVHAQSSSARDHVCGCLASACVQQSWAQSGAERKHLFGQFLFTC